MLAVLSALFFVGISQAADYTQTKLTASDAAAKDRFGFSTAISGTTAIVGAPWKNKKQGAAYIFDTTTGKQTGILHSSDPVDDHVFGWSVAISGTNIVIGAPASDAKIDNLGAVYVFDLTTGKQTAKLTPSDAAKSDGFGVSVAVSGSTAVVGALNGSAYAFDITTGKQTAKLVNSDAKGWDLFGSPVAVLDTIAIVGAPGTVVTTKDNLGAAYLFDTTTGKQLAKLTASDATEEDNFGSAVAITESTIIVGASQQDKNVGAAYLFDRKTLKQTAKLTANDGKAWDSLGSSVDLSGTTAIVGAAGNNSYDGAVYVFDTTTGKQTAKLTTDKSGKRPVFGLSVSIAGSKAIIGAYLDSTISDSNGAAYLVDLE